MINTYPFYRKNSTYAITIGKHVKYNIMNICIKTFFALYPLTFKTYIIIYFSNLVIFFVWPKRILKLLVNNIHYWSAMLYGYIGQRRWLKWCGKKNCSGNRHNAIVSKSVYTQVQVPRLPIRLELFSYLPSSYL